MARRLVLWGGGLAVLLAATAGLLYFATAGATQLRVEGERLYMSGPMNPLTLESFETLVELNPGLTTVVMGDIPSASEATAVVLLGYRLRGLQLDTELAPEAEMAGDAIWAFLGGVERRMGPDARLVVSDWGGAALGRDAPAHEERRRFVQDMLGDDAFYWATLEAAAPRALGPADLAAFGVVTAP